LAKKEITHAGRSQDRTARFALPTRILDGENLFEPRMNFVGLKLRKHFEPQIARFVQKFLGFDHRSAMAL
jgi:hypothetical protein